ncbi:MAG: amidohydrolase [Clostridia bacterium]|nr:amidohydrolase [Clostridia bacterium]
MEEKNYACGCVLMKDGKIAEVAEEIRPPEGCEVYDAKGGWVLPGLIEAHCHIGITEEKSGTAGDDCNEMMQPVTPHLRAIDAVDPMDGAFKTALGAGITGVMVGPGSSNVVGGQFAFLKTAGRNIDEMCVLAPAALKVAFGENPKNNYGGKGEIPSTRMTVAAELRRALFEARAYYEKRCAAAQNGETFERDFLLESYVPLFEGKIPLKAHAHRADDILTAIRIAKEFGVGLTLDHCTEGHLIAEEIAQFGCPAIVGPSVASRNKIEVQLTDFKTCGVLHKAGVTVAITTDHPVSRIRYLALCAGLAARDGLGVEEGLRAITVNAARICGVADRVGSLCPGKDADVAVFTGNPMDVFTKTLLTVIDGEAVYRAEDENIAK